MLAEPVVAVLEWRYSLSRRVRLGASLLALLAATATTAACGSGQKTTRATAVNGNVTVFAAASLTESFNDLQASLKTSDPGLKVTYSFSGSGALVAQVQQGAPADVIATADLAAMKKLTDAGLVEAPMTFAKNKLEILVAPGNPKGVHTLGDLARSDLKIVTEDDTVPAGKYAAQILQMAGVTVRPVSREADVKSAVAKITSGEADATIVYVTDVDAAGAKAQGVAIPDAQNVVAEYPIAIVKTTKNHEAAVAFVAAVTKSSGQAALYRHGFLPPA
ncbi:MAG: molybdate transport system substrate-binding protein [Acidimicrobiaceae bacterium]|nr:molybdate transport system substrate-binding protein [Acidimicrobiaceae bacterium]